MKLTDFRSKRPLFRGPLKSVRFDLEMTDFHEKKWISMKKSEILIKFIISYHEKIYSYVEKNKIHVMNKNIIKSRHEKTYFIGAQI